MECRLPAIKYATSIFISLPKCIKGNTEILFKTKYQLLETTIENSFSIHFMFVICILIMCTTSPMPDKSLFHFHLFYIICLKKNCHQVLLITSSNTCYLHISPTTLRKANTRSWAIRSLSIKQKSMYIYPCYYKLENMFIAELQGKWISFLKNSKSFYKNTGRHLIQQTCKLTTGMFFQLWELSKKLKEA